VGLRECKEEAGTGYFCYDDFVCNEVILKVRYAFSLSSEYVPAAESQYDGASLPKW
jgi:hypothetical protein